MAQEQPQLSEEQRAEIENSLNAETFDLDAFLNDEWNYPRFTATVYLDGERAAKIAELEEKISEAETKHEQARNKTKQQSSGSLGGGGSSSESKYAADELESLRNELNRLADEFRKSELKIVFQQQGDSREVLRYATEKTKQAYPDLSDKERENSDDASEYHGHWVMQQLISEIYDHQGRQFQGDITFDRVQKLASTVVASERTKLLNNMYQALSGGNVMKQAADAGFPR